MFTTFTFYVSTKTGNVYLESVVSGIRINADLCFVRSDFFCYSGKEFGVGLRS